MFQQGLVLREIAIISRNKQLFLVTSYGGNYLIFQDRRVEFSCLIGISTDTDPVASGSVCGNYGDVVFTGFKFIYKQRNSCIVPFRYRVLNTIDQKRSLCSKIKPMDI